MTAAPPAGPGAPGGDSRRVGRLAGAALLVVLVAFLVQQRRLEYTYPVPWPDEGSFLWQALAFRDGNTLFAPELHPTRHVMWMPPGFMILEGLLFKVLPFSLLAARGLSALYLALAVACLALAVRDPRARLATVALAWGFLSGPICSLAANVARMETLVLLVLSAAALAAERGRASALGLAALAPLVHPNGAFGALAIGIHYALSTRGARTVSRADRVVLVAALAAWVGYAVYVGLHVPAFLEDMRNQLRFKTLVSSEDGGPLGRAARPLVWSLAAVLVGSGYLARRLSLRVSPWVAVGLALVVQSALTAGWLYDVYPAFAAIAAGAVALDVGAVALERLPALARFSRRPAERAALGVVLGGSVVAGGYLLARHDPFLARSLDRAVVLRPTREPRYFTGEDGDVVARKLRELAQRHRRIRVQFLPDGEALNFERLRGPGISYVQQTFHESPADFLVLHDSAWFPQWVHDMELLRVFFMHPGHRNAESEVVRERDDTERWTVYRLRDIGPR